MYINAHSVNGKKQTCH